MLKAIMDSLDDVPEPLHEYYVEKGGKYELTGIQGVKTEADVTRVQGALNHEREARKAAEAKAKQFEVFGDPEALQATLDKLPELEAAAAGKIDDAKIDEIVQRRLTTVAAPLQRKASQLEAAVAERDDIINRYKQTERTRTIGDKVKGALTEAKVIPFAVDDALLLAERIFEVREDDGEVVTRENVGVTPGITPKDWIFEVQSANVRPHWFGATQGSGATGGTGGGAGGAGPNPWSFEHWHVTKQHAFIREHGQAKALKLAQAAGHQSVHSTKERAKRT